MKTRLLALVFLLSAFTNASGSYYYSDGDFHPTSDVEIDLSLAATGFWNTVNRAPGGVYDPDRWVVVFQYDSVNIPAGVKVTFKNHPSHAPVMWIVGFGECVINGEINLDGKGGTTDSSLSLVPAEPGPGGFRGGARGPSGGGHGYGPGAGAASIFSTSGQYGTSYGNPQIVPLIGGSGTGADNFTPYPGAASGGAGGGAITIYATYMTFNGIISAKGGQASPSSPTRTGSGGAIRLMTYQIQGSGGSLIAMNPGANNPGRIRVERAEGPGYTPPPFTFTSSPETIPVSPTSSILFPAANAPTARVVSVDAVNAPADPRAPLNSGADVAIQNNGPVNILIETKNFPIEGQVQLFITPKYGDRVTHTATRLSGDINTATWQVQTTLPQGYVTMQARVTQP